MKFKLIDCVVLARDLPEHGLHAGERGTIVEVLDATHVIVEFSDEHGVMRALPDLCVDDLLPYGGGHDPGGRERRLTA